jgi:hypothetical protein
MDTVERHLHDPTGASLKFGSAEYRGFFRNHLAGRLNGNLYVLINFSVLLAIILTLAISIPRYEPYFLLLLPCYLLFTNWLEYVLHRYPMHHKTPGFMVVYEHVTIHHNFYANRDFYFEEPRDYYAAVLPFYIFIGLTLVITAVSGLIYLGFGLSNALFFALIAYCYYLTYEVLHFSYHMPANSFVKRMPFINGLSRAHILHHQTQLMARYNFNITFPIFDWVFKTSYRGPKPEDIP